MPKERSSLRVSRINAGVYDVKVGCRDFEVERFPDGSWLLFQGKTGEAKPREYCNDFTTKRAAVRAAVALAAESV